MWLRMGVGRMRIDGQPRDMITTVLDGLTQLTADDCEVVYSRGANVIDLVPDPAGEFYPDGQPRQKIGVSAAVDQAMIDEAVANAPQSDLIVAVVGDVVQLVGETCSTATLELLGGQNALLDAFAAVSERNRQADGHRAHQLQAAGAARLPQLRRRVRVVRAPCGERAAAV